MRGGALSLVIAFALLAGCAGSRVSETAGRTHVVRPGETLFGIAWSYGLDHRELARWNGLDNPDLIYVGQRIRLSPAGASAPRTAVAASGSGGTRTAQASAASAPSSSSASSSRATVPAVAAASRPAAATTAPTGPMPAWRWPTEGRIVSRFGGNSGIATGIGIAGREGQAIEAVADGQVVYAGSGLISYGQLVIIRHNDTFLSAYGYNARLLVSQGQRVSRGQKIAEMGLGPERQPRLHFEIRRGGQPIDPLLYLPSR